MPVRRAITSWSVALVLCMWGMLSIPSWAQEAPDKKPASTQPAPSSQPAKSEPNGANLEEAKRKALQSIGKQAPAENPPAKPAGEGAAPPSAQPAKPAPANGGPAKPAVTPPHAAGLQPTASPPAPGTAKLPSATDTGKPAAAPGGPKPAGPSASPASPTATPPPGGVRTPPGAGPAPRPEPAAKPAGGAAERPGKPEGGPPGRDRGPGKPLPGRTPQPKAPAEGAPAAPAGEAGAGGEESALPPFTNTTTTQKVLEVTPIPAESRTYRFAYSKTLWTDVLADFSRMSGLSWLNDPEPPLTGELTFRSPKEMNYKEALHQLNELLLARPIGKYLIQRKENYLEIKTLPDLMREIPVDKMYNSFDQMEAANPDEFDIVLVYMDVPQGWSGYEIIDRFRSMFSDTYGTAVVGDRIELTGLVREHRRWRDTIEKTIKGLEVTQPPAVDLRPTLMIPLKVMKAADMQNMLRQMYPPAVPAGAPGKAGGPGIDPSGEIAKRVDIYADPINNRMIIKASSRQAMEISDTIAKLDVGEPAAPPQIKFVRLEHADATAVAAILKPLFQQSKGPAGPAGKPTGPAVLREVEKVLDRDIFPDAANNAVILVGSAEGIASAEEMVKAYDVDDKNRVRETIELKHAKADALAGTLLAALTRGASGKGGPGLPPPQITVRTSSTLLVQCSKQDLDDVKDLVSKLDVPPEDEAKEHLVKLSKAKPSTLAQILPQLFADGAGPRSMAPRPPTPPGTPAPVVAAAAASGAAGIRFIPVDATGYLIVYCTDLDWKRAEVLIKQLDEQERPAILESFALANADAPEVARMLQGMFPQAPPQQGQMPAREQIWADPYKNTVNVFANADFIEQVRPLIKTLDIQTKEPPTVIPLKNARAEVIAPTLQALFGGRGGGGAVMPAAAPPQAPGAPGQPPARPMMLTVAGGTSGAVTIVGEPITNSLIVSAPPKELEQIRKMVEDMEAAGTVKQIIANVVNRPAAELAQTLMSLMSTPRGATGRGGPGAAAANALSIVPDSDRLIMEGSEQDIGKALQYLDIIDVVEQKPITKKYAVQDPDKVETKLRTLLAMSSGGSRAPSAPPAAGGDPKAPAQPGGAPAAPAGPRGPRPVSASPVQMFPDIDEGTLLVRAMPRDFVEIEEQLAIVLKDAIDPPGVATGGIDDQPKFPFFTHRLKHKKALDVGFTVEDLVNTGQKNRIKIDEGPDEWTLLVRDCPPAKKDTVLAYIEMWDVPSGPRDSKVMKLDPKGKLPPEQIARLLQTVWDNPNKRQIEIQDMSTSSRVQVVDIHAGEPPIPGPSGSPAQGPTAPSTPPSTPAPAPASLTAPAPAVTPVVVPAPTPTTAPARPCVLPASLLEPLAVSPVGQLVQANRPRGPVSSRVRAMRGSNAPEATRSQGESVALVAMSIFDEPPTSAPGNPPAAPPPPPAPTTQPAAPAPPPAPTTQPAAPAPQPAPTPPPAASPTPPAVAPAAKQAEPAASPPAPQAPSPAPAKVEFKDLGGRLPAAAQPKEVLVVPPPANPPPTRPAAAAPAIARATGQPTSAAEEIPIPGGGVIKVWIDDVTGTVMIQAPEEDQDLIRAWFEELTGGESPTVYRIYQLRYADVTVAAQLLNSIFNQGTAAAAARQPRGRQAQNVPGAPAAAGGKGGEAGAPGSAPGAPGAPGQPQMQPMPQPQPAAPEGAVRLRVTPDPRTRSLWVAAPLSDVPIIEEVLRQVDSNVPPGEANIRIFRLINLDASDVVQNLRDILGLSGGGARRGRGGMQPGQPGQQMSPEQQQQIIMTQQQGGGQQPGQGVVVSEQNIQLTAVTQTNSIMAKAPPDTLNLIAMLIKQLEEQPESNPAVMKRVPLQHARAGDLAPVVRDVISKVVTAPGGGAPGMPPGMAPGGRAGGSARSGNVSVNADPRTNSIILAGQTTDVTQVEEIIKQLDTDSGGSNIKQIAVKGDAQSMANSLKAVFASGGGMPGQQQGDVVIVADAPTNTLIIKASGPLMPEIEKQVADMDAKVTEVQGQRTVKVLYADAEAVGKILQATFTGSRAKSGGKQDLTFTGVKASNIIFITGADDETFEKISDMVTLLDTPPTGMQVKAYALKNASATAVNDQLTQMLMKAATGDSLKGVKMDLVGVVPDARTNSLIVTGGPVTFSLIESVLAEVDKPSPVDVARESHNYVLPPTVNAAEVAANITGLFAGQSSQKTGVEPPTVAPNATANMVIVLATPAQHEQIRKSIIEPLTIESKQAVKTTRFIKLNNARADEVQRPLTEALQAKTTPDSKGKFPFTLVADVSTNSLIVTATDEWQTEVEKQVAVLDKPGEGERLRQVFKLAYADPDAVSRAIEQSFRPPAGKQPSPRDTVTSSTDPVSKSVIVSAYKENMDHVEQLIKDMDKAELLRTEYVIDLKNSNPNDVATSVQAILDAQGRATRTQITATIKAVPGTTKVIVFANAQEYEQVKGLVEQIDAGAGGRVIHTVVMPERVPAKTVAESINKVLGAQSPGGRGGASATDQARADYHEPTNTLLVWATETEFEKIDKQLIQPLSVTPAIGVMEMHKIPLKYANAVDVAKILQDFFEAKSGAATQKNLPFWARDFTQQQDNQVTIRAEPNSNMLIVWCTETTKTMIDDLLKDIDSNEPPAGTAKKIMKIVPLQHMDANEMLGILTEYLKVNKPATEDQNNNGFGFFFGRGRGGQQQQQEDKAVLAGDMRLKVVESMNAISVVGTEERVAEVEAKIKELDVETASGMQPERIVLKSARAATVAEIANKLFNDPVRNRTRGANYVPPIITTDETTNALFVMAKPSELSEITELAAQQDAAAAESPSGAIQLISVPVGWDVEDLGKKVEDTINKGEDAKKELVKDYRPSKVKINSDAMTNTLMVAATKSQFDEVKRLVDDLIARGPAGGRVRTVIQLDQMTSDKAKQLIEQLQQSSKGGAGRTPSGGGARRGPSGDATWTRHHWFEMLDRQDSRADVGTSCEPASCAGTLQGFFAQVAYVTAVAQVPTTRPADKDKPREVGRIRPQQPTTKPAEKGEKPAPPAKEPPKAPPAEKPAPPKPAPAKPGEAQKPALPGAAAPPPKAPPPGAGAKPAVPTTQPAGRPPAPGRTPEEQARAKAPGAGEIRMTPTAQEAFQKLLAETTVQAGPTSQPTTMPGEVAARRLSGQVDVTTAGSGTIVIDASPEDTEVIKAIVQMLDKAVPAKRIDYVKLKNSRAADLAKILTDVFARIADKSRDRQAGPEDKVDIIADPRTNGIYIAATEAKMAQALDLIAKADAEIPVDKNVLTYRFTNRRVSEAGPVLQKMVSAFLKQYGLPPDAITVELDPQNNSVFITGGEGHLAFAKTILEGLDAEQPEPKEGAKGTGQIGQADLMRVPLHVAAADKLGKLLNDMLQKAATGDTPMKDFIRRMRLLDEKGEPIAQIDLNRPIAIFGDADSNALIIASSKENCLIMKEIAKAFDKEPERAEVVEEMIILQYADASEVETQLNDLMKDSANLSKRAGGKGDATGAPEGEAGSLVYQAVVKVDVRTNQVLIVGRPETVQTLKGLVTSLDVKGVERGQFKIIHLEYASATALETALTDMMKARLDAMPKGKSPNAEKAETVIIKGDPRSHSLIVSANPARLEELRQLIKELDIPSTALIEDIHTITLKHGTATDLADKLKKLWEDRQKQQQSASKGFALEIPAIVADERSNSLIVAASKADFEAIKAVIDKIESLELNPMANIYIIRMHYNSAKSLTAPLKSLFDKRAEMRTVDGKVRPEDKVSIEADEVTNSLLVAASKENIEVLQQKIAEIDQEIGIPGVVEFFECTNVAASRVKETIDSMFKEGAIYKPGGKGEGKISQDREKVTTTVDDRSNILIASASPENMELVREVYKRMNSVDKAWVPVDMALVPVEHGDAVKIAAQVQDQCDKLKAIEKSGSQSKGPSMYDINMFADERSNRIVVGGSKDGLAKAIDMIKALDVEGGQGTAELRVYTLKEAPASTIKDIIDKIFQDRNQARQGAKGAAVPNVKVSVQARDANNSLVINASREDHELIQELITQIDRPSTLIGMVRVFPLEQAPADRIKEILDELYKTSAGADGKTGKSIGVVSDKRTNAVVVAAPPGELDNIEALVKRLDQTEVKGQAEVGVFTCDNEDAKKMSDLLNSIMTGKAVSGSSGGGGGGTAAADKEIREISSMLISFSAKDAQGRELLLKTIRENVQISYSERTNSVIVVAPSSSLKLIEQLVHKLDRIEKKPVLVKVFHLVNSDATKLVDLLQKMLAESPSGGGSSQQSQQQFQEGREFQVEGGASSVGGVPSSASQGGGAQKGTFGRPKTTFVADERTNSIIAAGWPEDVAVVADIIDQLDSQAVPDRENFVITLANKKVKDVQTALQSYFQAEQQRLQGLGETISPQRRMDEEVTVVAHEPSNQLLVSVSPRYKANILDMVEQIDLPPPEVMIQVMIAEVTLDDHFQMGLEFALQDLRFSETAVPGGNGVLQSSHFDVVGGTDLGAAGTGVAGFSFTMTGEDFNFLVRALQTDSRLEIIQRPMLMCQDNQQASIDLGQKVPFVRGTSTTTGGQVTSNVEYDDIGIKLSIEPTINPDGYVFLHLVQEISSITSSSINLGNGVLAPIFNNRKADTWIAVKDDETLVIGGLITTSDNESETKVPFLGDIPGIGILFRTTDRQKQKDELLIALTPRIIRTVEDGRRLSVECRDKAKIITPSMKQSPLFGKLQVLPEEGQEYPLEGEMPPAEAGTKTPAPTTQPYKAPPGGKPVKPAEPEKKYGPEAPKYGPLVPASDSVAQRNTEPVMAGSTR